MNSYTASPTYVPASTHRSSLTEFQERTLTLPDGMKIIAFVSRTAFWESIQKPSDECLNYQVLLAFLFCEEVFPLDGDCHREGGFSDWQRLFVPPMWLGSCPSQSTLSDAEHKFHPLKGISFLQSLPCALSVLLSVHSRA